MKLRIPLLILMALPLAHGAFAQITLNVSPAYCGLGTINCYRVPVTTGGSVWIDIYNRSNFLDFMEAGTGKFTGLTSSVASTIQTKVAINNLTHSPDNSYVLEISEFRGTDAKGDSFSGSGKINFHYYYASGSGRGGGGSGWHLQIDSGTFTIQ